MLSQAKLKIAIGDFIQSTTATNFAMSAEDWNQHLEGKLSVLDMEMIVLPKKLAVGPVSKLLLRPYGDHGVIAEVDDWNSDRMMYVVVTDCFSTTFKSHPNQESVKAA